MQPVAQAGFTQCMHCVFTYTSPLLVMCRFTTVNWRSVASRGDLYDMSSDQSGSGRPLALAQAASHERQPMHFDTSTSTPIALAPATVVEASAGAELRPTAVVAPTAVSLKKVLRERAMSRPPSGRFAGPWFSAWEQRRATRAPRSRAR